MATINSRTAIANRLEIEKGPNNEKNSKQYNKQNRKQNSETKSKRNCKQNT